MAWQAFITIIAIAGIVLIASGIIAFVGHMIINVFDTEKRVDSKPTKEALDYTQYKQNQQEMNAQKEFNYESINAAKAERAKAMSETGAEEDLFNLLEDNDPELAEIEKRLEAEAQAQPVKKQPENVSPVKETPKYQEAPKMEDEDESEDDFDIDQLLAEISDDVVENEIKSAQTQPTENSSLLSSYNIDDYLNSQQEDDGEVEEDEFEEEPVVNEPETKKVVEEEKRIETKQESKLIEEIAEDVIDIDDDDDEEMLQEVRTFIANKSLPAPPVIIDDRNDAELKAAADTIKGLKEQLESLNQQLEEVKRNKTTVVTVENMNEEQCLQRLLNLEERLKMVKKDYKINLREYRPLKKVMKDLEKFQTKLRRKDAVVAKKKVALYGVNNYVDIDKEKAEKLANELELLDGLRLSVAHCEEVINANKDRFPILERTNNILESQIAQLEEDIARTNEILQKIRDKQGNGSQN